MTTRTQICQTLSHARLAVGRVQARRLVPRALLLGALLSVACDDAAEQRKPGPTPAVPAVEPTPSKPPPYESKKPAPPAGSDLLPTPTGPSNGTKPSAGPDITAVVRTYSGCYTDCFTERASKTNRETCKLTCDAAAEATLDGMPGAPSKDVFKAATASFTGCVNACYADKSLNATNRATCVLTCQDAAEVAALGK